MQGWTCPTCHRSWSPLVEGCHGCTTGAYTPMTAAQQRAATPRVQGVFDQRTGMVVAAGPDPDAAPVRDALPRPAASPATGSFPPPEVVAQRQIASCSLNHDGLAPVYYFHVDDPWALSWFIDNAQRPCFLACIHPSAYQGDNLEDACGRVLHFPGDNDDSGDDIVRCAYYRALARHFDWRADNTNQEKPQ